MIKDFCAEQLDEVMDIWLQTNLAAHDFIGASYWQNNFEFVKMVLPTSEVKVFIEDGIIKGFIGVLDGYIAGLFVREDCQNQGVGKQLLTAIQKECQALHLDVYVKNERAVAFYKHQGFKVVSEKQNEDTHEMEYFMVWHQ
ncbi:MAG: N-acetyltransferase [Cellulosilyticaceae bacterium]